MKRILMAAAGALAFAGMAIAQDITTAHLAALDTNADGSVDAAAFDAFVVTTFTTLDANGDGYITAVEATVVMTPEQFAAANTNGDDGVSKAEFEAATKADFAAADKDGDGALN